MSELNAHTAIELGGWDPRYARVLDVKVDGDAAAALVDANGDGADLNVDVYRYRDEQWIEVGSGNGSIQSEGVRATWTDKNQLILARVDESDRFQRSCGHRPANGPTS